MREVTGNIWETDAEAIVIPTNGAVRRDGSCVMGRGLALQATRLYPALPRLLGNLIQAQGNQVYYLGVWHSVDRSRGILSFPVKRHWKEKANLKLIRRSVEELREKADEYGLLTVLLPRVGCGNGRLDWEEVRPLLEILDDRFTVVSLEEE